VTTDIRTPRGKLVGKFDEAIGLFSIKDGNKVTQITVPASGLKLSFTTGDGVTEEICIPPLKNNHLAA